MMPTNGAVAGDFERYSIILGSSYQVPDGRVAVSPFRNRRYSSTVNHFWHAPPHTESRGICSPLLDDASCSESPRQVSKMMETLMMSKGRIDIRNLLLIIAG